MPSPANTLSERSNASLADLTTLDPLGTHIFGDNAAADLSSIVVTSLLSLPFHITFVVFETITESSRRCLHPRDTGEKQHDEGQSVL